MSAPMATPLDIGSAPYTAPGPGQLVIRNGAVGVNPIDWVKQMLGDAVLGYIEYPIVIGEDVAGTVVAVGDEAASRFRVGDRVLAVAAAMTSNDATEGGFQLYTLAREWLAAPLPEHVNFEQACALPLALLTASIGLFDKDYLGLDMPSRPPIPDTEPPRCPRVVIIAGGASAVGGTAVQLAKAAGYEVVSTSSPRNFEHVERLGASRVLDYNSDTASLVDDLAAAVKGRQLCGCFSIGDETADVLAAVIDRHKKQEEETEQPTCMRIARAEGKHSVEGAATGIEVKFIVMGAPAIGPESPARPIFEDFLPRALAEKQFVPAPEPQVVGKGLVKIQDALLVRKQGVSAKKIVVSL